MIVKDYGDMLAKVKGLPLVYFHMFGSYQGEWLGILDAGDSLQLWKGDYGSCSGCDFLEAEGSYKEGGYDISDEGARKYYKGDVPFGTLPKSIIADLTLESLKEMLPANQRTYYSYDFSEGDVLKALKEALTK